MTTPHRLPGLSEPLGEHSRLVRRPGVQIGLLGEDLVLFQPDSLIACTLDEHAARLWLDCVGQPFTEVIESARRSLEAEPHDIIELFRVLRLFEMVADADATSPSGRDDRLASGLPRLEEFRFRGELTESGNQRLAIISIGSAERAVDLRIGPGGNSGPITFVIAADEEQSEREVHGLDAVTALARSVPDAGIDQLIQVALRHRVLLRPGPAD